MLNHDAANPGRCPKLEKMVFYYDFHFDIGNPGTYIS